MRVARWLIVLAVLAGAYVAADVFAQREAKSNVATALQAELNLSKKPEVNLGSFPFLLRALDGQLPLVTLKGSDISANDQPFEQVQMRIRTISFGATSLVLGRDTTVNFKSSQGSLIMSGPQAAEALQSAAPGIQARVAGGAVHLSGGPLTGEVTVTPTLESGGLVLTPTAVTVPVSLRIDLGLLVPSVQFDEVKVEGSNIVARFQLKTKQFEV
jgi:hypothetical protein